MTLVVQDDDGTVTGANGYVTVQYFKDYHDARGNAYASLLPSDAAIGRAIIKATDYVDQRFYFRGSRAHPAADQPTAWPRLGAVDDDDNLICGVPEALKRATAEYALRAAAAALNPDPTRDATGRSVQSVSQTVGPVSQSKTFANASSLALPRYPAADRLLASAGLVDGGSARQWGRA